MQPQSKRQEIMQAVVKCFANECDGCVYAQRTGPGQICIRLLQADLQRLQSQRRRPHEKLQTT